MKQTKLLVLSLLISQCVLSQIYEVGMYFGGSNFIGDVGSTSYIAPKEIALGGIFKWNRSPRHSYRLSIIKSKLSADDTNSDDPRRINRGYSFSNDITEISIGMEYTFWEFNLHESGFHHTPYLYTGASFLRSEEFYFQNNPNATSLNAKQWSFAIPMTVGYKAAISRQLILALDIGVRYSFSDDLDGSNSNNEDVDPIYQFGNPNSKDWYTFTGFTLTYTFGRKPCYCNF